MKKQKNLLFAFMLGLLLMSCDNDDDNEMSTRTLSLEVSGLQALGEGYAYEGWIIVDGAPVSTGVFSIDENGSLSSSEFEVDVSQLEAATMFVVSIEPSPDSDPAPAATKVLSGEFNGSTASLNTGLVGDFSGSGGSFFLRTPTDETDGNNNNDEYGVWFGLPGMPPAADLDLPDLPAGWAYEGWVVGETGPITTGTFTDFSSADDAAPYSGDAQSGPPIPGEDFLMNAPSGETFPLDVRGRMVVISVEPVPDDSEAPFAMKPLVGTAGQETAPATYEFGQNLGSLPTGSASY